MFAKKHFERIRPSSAQRYFASLKQLIPHFGAIQIDEIRSSHLAAFEDKRRAEGIAGASIRRDLACMSVMYSYAESWEWVARNPVKPYLFLRKRAGLKDSPPRERFLSHPEEEMIIVRIAPKARDALIFAIDTGLRKNEQFSLPWVDVDLRARELLVRGQVAKNGKDRTVPLLPRTHQLLTRMWDERQLRCPYVFATAGGKRYSPGSPTMWEALQGACKRAGITEHVEWHDLRRTCGCRLLQDRGFSMEVVSKWLGHSSIVVTERHYAFLGKADLHKAVARSEAQIIPLGRAQFDSAIPS